MACNEGDQTADPVAITEVELVIDDPNTPPEELLLLVDFVSYRITCPGSGLTPYDDSVDLNGHFEVDASASPPVWELATSLPLSECAISLWVFYENEVMCQGSEVIPLVEDSSPLAPNKVNIVLQCNLSVNGPSANLDIDGTFEFINGNYCPKMNWLGAMPTVVEATVPAVTSLEVSAFDVDSTCGLNCDPQLCDFTQSPPVCTASPDPGFTTTLYAPAGHGSFDSPVATGTPMTGGTPVAAQATYTCDPLFPGPTEICAIASDGDNDCDQMRCITVICPDLCEGVVCADDGEECTREWCDPLSGECVTADAPDGIQCQSCTRTCVGGVCSGPEYIADQNASVMSFVGVQQVLMDQTLINPYSGTSFDLTGPFNINTSSYKGVGADDVLLGTNIGDYLLIQDPIGEQRICGVETILAGNSFDALVLADEFIVLGDMRIEGNNSGDLIWANAGNDILRGLNGRDFLAGGPGNDIVEGGEGNDTVYLWPGSGYDSISGGDGDVDTIEILAIQSQITITQANPLAADPYEFDIAYLGKPMAQIRGVELINLSDASIELTACTGSDPDVCNLCGNDALNGTEECDDGNNVDGDGCSATCAAEY